MSIFETSSLLPFSFAVSIWSVKHQPKHSDEIVGNQDSVKKLYSTLSNWKKRLLKDGKSLKPTKIEGRCLFVFIYKKKNKLAFLATKHDCKDIKVIGYM